MTIPTSNIVKHGTQHPQQRPICYAAARRHVEFVIKDREIRSQKPDVHYQLSSPLTRRSHDDTVPLDDGHVHSTPTVSKTTQPLEVLGASDDEAKFWANLDLVFPNATMHELGGPKTASHTTVVYSDAIVTTVSTSLTPTATL